MTAWTSQTLWEEFKNWDWDFGPLWLWAKTTVHFWLTVHPWTTWPVVILVCFIILLSFDLTHGLVVKVFGEIAKWGTVVLITLPSILVWKLLGFLGRHFVARFRDAVRYFRGLFSTN